MARYQARIGFEDADGGTWDEEITFDAANNEAADSHASEHAEGWFQGGEEIGTGKDVPGPVKASIELRNLDTDEAMTLDITPDHDNDSGTEWG